jgi:thiol-disulfide isomerase/thioredoxin
LLARSVVRDYGGRVRFVSENFGASALARRFGVTRYPAIFVDSVLVATPRDFGFYGKGEGAGDGRYTPFKTAASHERFRADLAHMIDLVLAGRGDLAKAAAARPEQPEIESLPTLALSGLDGRLIARESLAGRVVIVEFWATWCPPCRGTLRWLGDLQRAHGDRLTVVALSVASDEADVRKLAGELALPLRWAMATPDLARAFGDVTAVPTMFVFDATGHRAATFYGAPPTLHAEAEARIAELLAARER